MVSLGVAALRQARPPCLLVFVALGALLLPAPSGAQSAAPHGPTFDCQMARKPSELRICLSPNLASLDVSLSEAYAAQRAALLGADDSRLRLAQRAFLQHRDGCQGDEACLRAVMQARLAELQTGITPAPGGPASASASAANPPAPAQGDARQQRLEQFEERRAELQQEREQRLAARQQARSPEEMRQAKIQFLGGDQDRPPPPDTTPAGDEWRGVYSCGGYDSFLRLVVPQGGESGKGDAIIEFGPAPGSTGPRGSFSVTGTAAKAPGGTHASRAGRLDPSA